MILEGRNDKNIFKAVFLIGPPGAGKTTIGRHLLEGTGLKVINIDEALEFLAKKQGVDLGIPHTDADHKNLYQRAFKLTSSQRELYIEGRLGLVIDGTGRRFEPIAQLKAALEEIGYQTMVVAVTVPIDMALTRNSKRDRKVDPRMLRTMYGQVRDNLPKYKALFGQWYINIENIPRGLDPEQMHVADKTLRRFLSLPRTSTAENWRQLQHDVQHDS